MKPLTLKQKGYFFFVFLCLVFLSLLALGSPRLGLALAQPSGGPSWIRQDSGTDATLRCVSAVDSKTAWVGGDGIILRTLDGGNTWKKVYEKASTHVFGIWALDADRVWIVGREGEPGTGVNFIAKTLDGGASWTVQYVIGEPYYFTSISAANERTAWAVGNLGRILKTTDGGNSWVEQRSGTSQEITCVYAVSEQVAWAGARSLSWNWNTPTTPPIPMPPPFQDAPYLPILLKTTDGGGSWQSVMTGTYNEYVADVEAATALDVVAVGADIVYSPIPILFSTPLDPSIIYLALQMLSLNDIMVTHDGGVSWWFHTRPASTTSYMYGSTAPRPNIAWAVAAYGSGYRILKTSDGGSSWVDETPLIDIPCDLLDVSSRDGVTAWAVGYRGLILRTASEVMPLTLTSVRPNTGNQLMVSLNLSVEGTGFTPGAAVKLIKGSTIINAYNVNMISSSLIQCTVGLMGVEPGVYDLVVELTDGRSARLAGAFTVQSACGTGSMFPFVGLAVGLTSLVWTAGRRRRRDRAS